jgi:dsRNA-specific ribonuclease
MAKRDYRNEFLATKHKEQAFLDFTELSMIKNRELFKQAMTCVDFAQKYKDATKETVLNNKSIAIIGDAVLTLALSLIAFENDKAIKPEKVTMFNQPNEKNKYLGIIGKEQNIINMIFASNEEYIDGGIATAYEAIIAFVFMEYGIKAVQKFVEKNILTYEYLAEINEPIRS